MTNLKNIMICMYEKEDVLIRGTTLSMQQLKECFKKRKVVLSDIYEVNEEDIQYHSFDSLFADGRFDAACLN